MGSLKRIVVLHEFGANSHYLGLQEYCNEKNIQILFREFVIIRPLFNSIRKLDYNSFVKSLTNFFFFIGLFFSKNKIIVLGMAPYDWRMLIMNFLSKNHLIYFHSSWTSWDGSFMPKNQSNKIFREYVKKCWIYFLEDSCKGIFCVTEEVKVQLKENFNIICGISVVYHSIDRNVFKKPEIHKTRGEVLNVLFVGRLVKEKGIQELLNIILEDNKNNFSFGVIGDGLFLKDEIIKLSKENPKVMYYGKLSREKLGEVFSKYDILLCPSKKTIGVVWEELFGMVIVEGMACGLIPVATNHKGPVEIINSGTDGFLINDDEKLTSQMYKSMLKIKNMGAEEYETMLNNCFVKGETFYKESIKNRWAKILNQNINC